MSIISIIGNIDKRIVAIPLARGLSIDGKTAIITDDTSYRRLYKNGENLGSIDGLNILIDYDINENSIEKLSETYETHKHFVFVSDNFIHKESNVVILCKGRDRSLIADDVAQKVGQLYENEDASSIKCKEITITVGSVDKVDKKEANSTIQMTDKYYKYLGTLEETKTLDAPKDTVLAKKIARLVGNDAGVLADTLEKLINRKLVIDIKEVPGRRKKK